MCPERSSTNISGSPVISYSLPTVPSPSRTLGKLQPKRCTNARALPRLSLQSTPTIRPLPSALREKRSIAGASWVQGPHQLAQNTTSDGCPFALDRSVPSVTSAPERCSRGSAGAVRPELLLLG